MTTEIFKIVIKKSKVVNDLENFKEFGETKENYVFQNLPRAYFEKGSIKATKIEEGNIYLGTLKPKYQHLKGSGILSRFITKTKNKVKDKVIDVFSPRLNDYNNQTKRMLAKYGHEQIVSMAIYRTPLPSMINKVINVVSLGQWEQLKKKYGFDKFFHLALVLTLKNNKNIIVEKNEVINVSDSYKTNSNTEVLPIEDYKNPTNINALLDRTRKAFGNDALYFGYDPFNNNCQVFIKNILVSNGLYNMKINNFLFQDIQQLTKELNPLTKGIMRGTTNLAGTVNKLLGKGKKGKFIKVNKSLIGMRGKGILEDIMKIEKDKEDEELIKKYYKQKTVEVIDYLPFFIEKYKNKDVCIENKLYHLDINPEKKDKNDFIKKINEEDTLVFKDFNLLDKIIEKCKKRLLIIPTMLDSIFFNKQRDKINHQTGFIIDKKLKTVEYFDPHGKDSHKYSDDLDDNFNDIFKKLGYRYLYMDETCPDYSYRDIKEEFIKDEKLKEKILKLKEESKNNKIGFQAIDEFAGTEIGFCFSWTFFYVESRIENPDIEPKRLKERINKEFENNPFKYLDFITKYALYLVKSTTSEEEKRRIDKEKMKKKEEEDKYKKLLKEAAEKEEKRKKEEKKGKKSIEEIKKEIKKLEKEKEKKENESDTFIENKNGELLTEEEENFFQKLQNEIYAFDDKIAELENLL